MSAQAGRFQGGLSDRIRNVVKLEVEEDPDPFLKDLPDDGGPGSREELKADLEVTHLVLQVPYQLGGLLLSRNIKSHNQLLGLGIRLHKLGPGPQNNTEGPPILVSRKQRVI